MFPRTKPFRWSLANPWLQKLFYFPFRQVSNLLPPGIWIIQWLHISILLDNNVSLTLSVEGMDQIGNNLEPGSVPHSWSFTVTGDNIAPDGTIRIEGDKQIDVRLDAAVIIIFTEPMRTDSINYTFVPNMLGELLWDKTGQVATFHHVSNFLAR